MTNDLVSQHQASLMLDVSMSTIQRMRKQGMIRTVRVGRTVRIPSIDIERICLKNPHDFNKQKMGAEDGSSISQMENEADERAYGRRIARSLKLVSKVG